jgi:hypothetical protein
VIVRTDSAARPLQNYINAWGAGINFLELDKQGAEFAAWPGLANGGSTVQIVDDQSSLVASIAYDNAPPWPTNNDGSSIYLTDLAASNLSDGAVDGADFLIWQRGVGTMNAARTDGDANDDDDVDGVDLAAWQQQFGSPSPAPAFAAPERRTWALVSVAGSSALCARRRYVGRTPRMAD